MNVPLAASPVPGSGVGVGVGVVTPGSGVGVGAGVDVPGEATEVPGAPGLPPQAERAIAALATAINSRVFVLMMLSSNGFRVMYFPHRTIGHTKRQQINLQRIIIWNTKKG
jgi:hypothetical protein